MGCLVGGVAQFKNQNEVNYLPLELSADEVTLAAAQGWIELFPETAAPVRAAAARAEAAYRAATAAGGGSGGAGGSWRRREADNDWEDAYQEYYSQFDPRVGFTGKFLPLIGAKRRRMAVPPPLPSQEQRQGEQQAGAPQRPTQGSREQPEQEQERLASMKLQGRGTAGPQAGATEPPADEAAAARAELDRSEPGWQAALAEGSVGRVGWSYPATDYERLRFAVFADLHRQGFMMTGGIKFGSDMLAYPGDPSLYHAQFTVRPVPPGAALNPMVLKAVARGSHAARKHLLLAFYQDGGAAVAAPGAAAGSASAPPPRIGYMSVAPEAGFGSKA
ncbi:hypothetical protein GPECTOR_49g495 [Gonium pectorale]|uniref:tRNA-intron lyase n=1 Tax=Gonium pectorale TaxID=33097 RepID=A0A150G7W5_GONPE|nr:hypothetical protein GPECTOR_49g495 [Gonium pectorale]|eukprot:KXZ45911.1 hypothetical protein GPECTOR_49g495 [Gonium pectorale]